MKFNVGDKVKEIHPPYEVGVITEATRDDQSSTGEFYLIDFGLRGLA